MVGIWKRNEVWPKYLLAVEVCKLWEWSAHVSCATCGTGFPGRSLTAHVGSVLADVDEWRLRSPFPLVLEQTGLNLSLDVLLLKNSAQRPWGLYLEALWSPAVCKLCVNVLHGSLWPWSEGFKHDLEFLMICGPIIAASAVSADSPGCFLTVALRGFHVTAAPSDPGSGLIYEQTLVLVGGLLNIFIILGSSGIFPNQRFYN